MNLKQRGRTETRDFAITYYEGEELRGLLHWQEQPRLYIDHLSSSAPAGVASMFAAFRAKYPNREVFFETIHPQIERFARRMNARKASNGYVVSTSTLQPR